MAGSNPDGRTSPTSLGATSPAAKVVFVGGSVPFTGIDRGRPVVHRVVIAGAVAASS
jgi:hypothetical protein